MRVQFLGAAQTVTGSRYLVRAGGNGATGLQNVLVDCGLFQGYKNYREKNWAAFPIKPSEIATVLLTHAHIDHSGYLPRLVKCGFRGRIVSTEATYDLCRIMLPDAGYLQEEEAAYANRKRFSKHNPALPLYTEADANETLKYFSPVPLHAVQTIGDGIEAEFFRAGHILGAASVRLKAERKSILFSGDLGRSNEAVMLPPEKPTAADVVVVESTYGNRLHDTVDPLSEIKEVINRTVSRGGIVLIPSFAVGRAQLLLYYIHELKRLNAVPDVPVYLNSPMASKVNEVFIRHCGETRLSPVLAESICRQIHVVQTPEQSIWLNKQKGPMVLIAASGMATGGRVLHHLKAFGGDPKNTILFAGFQVGGTRGDQLVRGATEVKIHGELWPIRAEVVDLHSLSAHADSNELMAWLSQMNHGNGPKQVLITHGELEAADALRRRIETELGWRAHVPDFLETVEI